MCVYTGVLFQETFLGLGTLGYFLSIYIDTSNGTQFEYGNGWSMKLLSLKAI